MFEQLLTVLPQRGLVKASGKQRTGSTHILAAVHTLSRLELVDETVRAALEVLALNALDWLRQQVSREWLERYGRPLDDYQLPKDQVWVQQYYVEDDQTCWR